LDALDNNNCAAASPEDVSAVAIGALIHDALQGPWGHSLETVGSLFVSDQDLARQARLDKLLVRSEIDNPASELRDVVEQCLRDADRSLVLDKLKIILDKDVCRRKRPEIYYLAELLDFLIDADRLDYLRRDAIHTYDDPPKSQSWTYIIQGTRTEWLQDPENKRESRPLRRLVFHEDHKEIIEDILTFRRDMYDSVYEHPQTIIIDGMLTHALFYAMRQNRIVPALETDRSCRDVALKAAREVSRLTDDDLLYFILETIDHESADGRQALELILDVYRDRPYKEVLPRYTISRDKMRYAETNLEEGLKALNRAILQQAQEVYAVPSDAPPWEASYTLRPNEFLEVAQEVLGKLVTEQKWGDYEDLLLFDFYLLRGRFIQKYKIEQSFWKRLLRVQGFLSILKNYLAARYGTADTARLIDEAVPLVHISLTNYTRYTAREMREHATEPAHVHERLAFYNPSLAHADKCKGSHAAKNGCMYSFYTPDPATSERFEAWTVVISGPAELVDDPEAASIISALWRQFMFRDRIWILAMREMA
jgi:HD superfamily phosphohydrolase